jgi:hypothetical protein
MLPSTDVIGLIIGCDIIIFVESKVNTITQSIFRKSIEQKGEGLVVCLLVNIYALNWISVSQALRWFNYDLKDYMNI